MVFSIVLGHEYSGRVRTQGFGVTHTRYFSHSISEGRSSDGSSLSQIVNLRVEVNSLCTEMMEFMQQFQMQHPPEGSSQMLCKISHSNFNVGHLNTNILQSCYN
ncbi:hypothetical protein KFK09_009448 [Dendrobium nobile]|uniref:Uncharacterized protein n=1 Tax=Dendrobium nobile TaxID=94219 RepID=A0A8T3BH68_DENNO|nr:hypothetical protein KFK09_009448 [Dendrobium nobile]